MKVFQEKYRSEPLTNIDAKILNRILTQQIQQYIFKKKKKTMHHDHVGFIYSGNVRFF